MKKFTVLLLLAILIAVSFGAPQRATAAQGVSCAALTQAGAKVTGMSEQQCADILKKMVENETKTKFNLFSPFPRTGQKYDGYVAGKINSDYDAVWTASGWLWQSKLPTTRLPHEVSVLLDEGNYEFNGVICSLYLDLNHNGQGQANLVTVEKGNNLRFRVENAKEGVSWGKVLCEGGPSSGFSIQFLNPLK